jgi:hypothetical protein
MNDTNYQEEVIKRLDAIIEALGGIKTETVEELKAIKHQMRFYQSGGSKRAKEQKIKTEDNES